MATIFSGMQPTGSGLHLGNYLGALRPWVKLVESGLHKAIFAVVDAHALTADYDPKTFPQKVHDTALTYLAAGLDPDKCTLFVQSEVKEHTELAWYLACVAPMGELGRMTQFKEKSEQTKNVVNAGLFTYPILMAADILLYKGTLVPVGADQIQHLEFSRDTARHFNKRFGKDIFPEPAPHPLKLRIKGIDGAEKMSKSRGNTIELLDPPNAVWKKLRGAFTDPQRITREIGGRPEVCNIFTMHQAVTPEAKVVEIDRDCRSAAIGCGDCKKMLHESLEVELVPLRTKAEALRAEPARVTEILHDGATTCRRIAAETMREVRSAMGLSAG